MSAPPTPSTKPRRTVGPWRALLLYTRGLIVDQHLRRVTMFYAVLAAMLLAFAGDMFLGGWLNPREHFYRFAAYWLLCGWLTILSALLAIYDMLMLRIQHRLLRRALRAKMLDKDLPTGEREE